MGLNGSIPIFNSNTYTYMGGRGYRKNLHCVNFDCTIGTIGKNDFDLKISEVSVSNVIESLGPAWRNYMKGGNVTEPKSPLTLSKVNVKSCLNLFSILYVQII